MIWAGAFCGLGFVFGEAVVDVFGGGRHADIASFSPRTGTRPMRVAM